MHLSELLRRRHVPAAGVLLALTRRCPLTCRHCSTSSLMGSEQHPAEPFVRFVRSFTPDDHPEFLLLSGGEPLLRPRLVGALARHARAVGTRSYLLTGAYFAREPRLPAAIERAIAAVDHLAVSLDAFHDEQVDRTAVIELLHRLVAAGREVSVQAVGVADDDPYLADVTAAVRRAFADRVPILVGRVGPIGRAAAWHAPATSAAPPADLPVPCAMAAWPVVAFDGTIVGCCNQRVVDGAVPDHLRLGHAAEDGWPAVAERLRSSPTLRAIRAYGPRALAARVAPAAVCDGYCETCSRLGGVARASEELMRSPPALALEVGVAAVQNSGGAPAFARRHGVARYADLVGLAG